MQAILLIMLIVYILFSFYVVLSLVISLCNGIAGRETREIIYSGLFLLVFIGIILLLFFVSR